MTATSSSSESSSKPKKTKSSKSKSKSSGSGEKIASGSIHKVHHKASSKSTSALAAYRAKHPHGSSVDRPHAVDRVNIPGIGTVTVYNKKYASGSSFQLSGNQVTYTTSKKRVVIYDNGRLTAAATPHRIAKLGARGVYRG